MGPPTVIQESNDNLDDLIEKLKAGEASEIIIFRGGQPAARLLPIEQKERKVQLGLGKGKYVVPATIDADNDLILDIFGISSK